MGDHSQARSPPSPPPGRLRVLYLHGFEEGPQSPKPQALAMRKDALALRMPALGVYLSHRHSPLLGALASRSLRWYAAALLAGWLALYVFRESLGRRAVLILGLALLFAVKGVLPGVKREAMAWSVGRSFEIARRHVREFRPDVVVGFSWGGMLAARLVARELWTGPTLLLAPAYEKLVEMETGKPIKSLQLFPGVQRKAPPVLGRVAVVASETDQIVPIERMRAFCDANGFPLTIAAGPGNEKHSMFGIARDGTLVDHIFDVAGRPRPPPFVGGRAGD